MKKLIILSIALFGSIGLLAQTNSIIKCDSVLSHQDVDVLPKFKSDNFKYPVDYVLSQINFPEGAHIEGTVEVTFIITKEGKITDIKILKGLFPEMDNKVIVALNTMRDWIPGKKNGKNVNTLMYLKMNIFI